MPRVCNECGADMESIMIFRDEETGYMREKFYCAECDNSIMVPIKPVESSSTHLLKTWTEYFQEVWDGNKTFEFRKNDRDFKQGDTLTLAELDKATELFTGREIRANVTYVLKDQMNVPEGYAILSLGQLERVV